MPDTPQNGESGIVQWLIKEYGFATAGGVLIVVVGIFWGGTHLLADPGGSVKVLWGLIEYTKEGTPSTDTSSTDSTNACQQELDTIKKSTAQLSKQVEACTAELSSSIPILDIGVATGEKVPKEEIPEHLRQLADRDKELRKYETSFAFKLFKLERAVRDRGGSINVSIDSQDRHSDYRLIQQVLQEIGHFFGSIDGASQNTYNALKAYQETYNQQVEEEFRFKQLGYLGYGTLESIRSTKRMRERNS
ncbi:MAG: hypothetical protein GKS05_11655 [Nitrospirales bacterium]|nr:hypothetical protein [Nitrospirales bacterium]